MSEVASKVEAVTVYRRGAMVTRTISLTAAGGRFPEAITVGGLPLSLDDSSIRIELKSAGEGASPVAGDVKMTVSVPGENPRLPPPDEPELEAAALVHAKARRHVDDLKAALDRIEGLEVAARGQPEDGKPPDPSPTGPRLDLLAFRRRRSTVLYEEFLAARARLHQAEERLATLRERKRVASKERNAATWEVRKAAIIRLETPSSAAAAATLRLRYFVPGARWAPAYTVRLDREMLEGTLEVRALVGQATGEDWRSVAMTLSTATPQQWTELPELKAMRIGRAQPEPRRTGWRPAPEGADKLYADYDRDLAKPPPPPLPQAVAAPPAPHETGAYPVVQHEKELAALEERGGLPPQSAPKRRGRNEPDIVSVAPPAAAAPEPTAGAARGGPPVLTRAAPSGAPMPQSKSAGIGSMLAGAVGAAVGGVATAFGSSGDRMDGFGEEGQAAAPRSILAGRDLLDYGRLQLHPPDHQRRGALQRVGTRAAYEHLAIETLSIEVAFERIDVAVGKARRLDRRAPPTGYRDPTPEPGFDYAYVADAPVDLKSDGRFHAVPVLAASADATPRYISVPRESQDVFRVVALRNPLEAPILPGPADVYVDGTFKLTSDIELTPVGGRVELGLGVEQAIKIARNVDYEEDTSGLISRKQELVHTIRVEIANHLSRAAAVEVRERVPVTRDGDDDVEVTLRRVEPGWVDYEQSADPLEGGKVWKVDVPAGGKRELRATWAASIPSSYELVGGNRRES